MKRIWIGKPLALMSVFLLLLTASTSAFSTQSGNLDDLIIGSKLDLNLDSGRPVATFQNDCDPDARMSFYSAQFGNTLERSEVNNDYGSLSTLLKTGNTTVVPEPSSTALLFYGLGALIAFRRWARLS